MAGTPLGPDHRFQIGSISKSFAVICALQLEAEGALALDDPLVTHLPWFQVGGGHGTITLRHLLMHRSGLPLGSDPGPSSLGLVADLAGRRDRVGARHPVLVLERRVRRGSDSRSRPSRAYRFPSSCDGACSSRSACTTRLRTSHPEDRCHLADGHESVRPDIPWHPGVPLATSPFAPSEGASGQHRLDRRRHGSLRPPPARPPADRVRPHDRRASRRRGLPLRPGRLDHRPRRPPDRRPLRGHGRVCRPDAVRHGRRDRRHRARERPGGRTDGRRVRARPGPCGE